MNLEYATTIASYIKKSNKIAFFHHERPDWDTVSSSYALAQAVKKTFPHKEVKWIADKEELQSNTIFKSVNYDLWSSKIDNEFLAVVGDVNGHERIYLFSEYEKAKEKICFDHHRSEIDFKHDVIWQEPDLPASSIQSYYIAKALDVKFDSKLALSFLAGILTDTGYFSYSLANPIPLQAAKELMEHIDDEDIDEFHKTLKMRSAEDIKIQGYILSNMKIEDGISYFTYDKNDIAKTGIKKLSAKQYVSTIGNIQNVHAWAMLIEEPEENCIKISLRSHGLKVNDLAAKFNGGGHYRAAGIKIDNDWNQAKHIIDELKKAVKEYLKLNN